MQNYYTTKEGLTKLVSDMDSLERIELAMFLEEKKEKEQQKETADRKITRLKRLRDTTKELETLRMYHAESYRREQIIDAFIDALRDNFVTRE